MSSRDRDASAPNDDFCSCIVTLPSKHWLIDNSLDCHQWIIFSRCWMLDKYICLTRKFKRVCVCVCVCVFKWETIKLQMDLHLLGPSSSTILLLVWVTRSRWTVTLVHFSLGPDFLWERKVNDISKEFSEIYVFVSTEVFQEPGIFS